MTDEFLTVAEVASVLKLNQQTVRNWIEPRIPGSIHYLDFRIIWISVVLVMSVAGSGACGEFG